MSVIISSAITLDTSPLAQFGPDNPIIGWENLIDATDVVADYEDADFPAHNVSNPSTYLYWKSANTNGQQTIQLNGIPVNEADYVAIAGHNLGSAAIPVMIEGFTITTSPGSWITLVDRTTLADDTPAIFRFVAQDITNIRLIFGAAGSPAPTLGGIPQIAVVYVGTILILERKVWIDHTPITYGRVAKIANGRSESGNFLGRIVLNERNETAVNVQHVSPAYYRSDIDPFIAASKESPFFFAWRPSTYPSEVGYAWMMNDPKVTHVAPHGLMQLELQMQGLV